MTGRNAADSDSVLIANLTTFTGEVSIVAPHDINPEDYQSILVHCEALGWITPAAMDKYAER